ncbi:MAG: radical SAM protein [Spirochaetales bacterium]|nr:radical SAM protein [Spirochaetales bacterium]
MEFPGRVSFTLTNTCNLRCRMCGQWSEEGYIRERKTNPAIEMKLDDWKRLVDECGEHHITSILLRGGEPFLFPGIIELLEYTVGKGMHVSIDTNGTMLSKYAADIVRIGNIHLTVSVDGPRSIHDSVRGVTGCFDKVKKGLAGLSGYIGQRDPNQTISTSICFTISRYSYRGLGAMPDVAREMGVGSIVIVPYYYVPESVGREYERQLHENLDCNAYSWTGFHHEDSGVDFDVFRNELKTYMTGLEGLYNYPYMPLTENEYRIWFDNATTPVGPLSCHNVERLLDIQPSGDANFCVDFPDYTIGNCREATIEEVWNSGRANRFRSFRRNTPLAVCYRCGAKYMSEQHN